VKEAGEASTEGDKRSKKEEKKEEKQRAANSKPGRGKV